MNEKQSMLAVIGSQTMQITILRSQLEAVQAENEALKKQVASAPAKSKAPANIKKSAGG